MSGSKLFCCFILFFETVNAFGVSRQNNLNYCDISSKIKLAGSASRPRFLRKILLRASNAALNEDDILLKNITDVSTNEAKSLLLRAQQLRAEAYALELALEEKKKLNIKKKEADVDLSLNRIFPSNFSATATILSPQYVAKRIYDERMSEDDIMKLLDGIYRRRKLLVDAAEISRILASQQLASSLPTNLSLISQQLQEFAANQTQFDQYSRNLQVIVQAVSILDEQSSSLMLVSPSYDRRWSGRASKLVESRMQEWRRNEDIEFQRRLAVDMQLQSNDTKATTIIATPGFVTKSVGVGALIAQGMQKTENATITNNTHARDRISHIPMWVPSSLLHLVASSQSVFDPRDIQDIKEKVLAKSRFFCTSSDSIPSAAVFRGNFRPALSATRNQIPQSNQKQMVATVFKEIQQRMDREGLSQRMQLFLLEDPEWKPDKDIRTRERGPKPIILALPTGVVPKVPEIEQSLASVIIKQSVVALSLLTTLSYSVSCYALNPSLFDAVVNKQDVRAFVACLPIFVGIIAVQIIHELAHWLVARSRGMKIGWPLLLPSTTLGLFGAITPLRSYPPNRSALIDFSLSGPVAGIVLSTTFMIVGSVKTACATHAALLKFPFVPVVMLKSSFLSGSILSYMLPKLMLLPQSQPIPIHPLFMIGFAGALVSALNLLPIFRLDGGRACTAAVGHRLSDLTSAWTLLSLLSLGLSGSNIAWAWGGLVFLFQRKTEIPARDEVTVVNDTRMVVWIASLAASVIALAPFPGGRGII
jgi:Zn-dependent protease